MKRDGAAKRPRRSRGACGTRRPVSLAKPAAGLRKTVQVLWNGGWLGPLSRMVSVWRFLAAVAFCSDFSRENRPRRSIQPVFRALDALGRRRPPLRVTT
jgi:hypothetical protein